MTEENNLRNHIILECDCHMHAVEFEILKDGELKEVYQGLWMACPSEDNLWSRIKAAWAVLTKGESCLFEVIWKKEQMQELRDWLDKILK